jgi:hypothetical protein
MLKINFFNLKLFNLIDKNTLCKQKLPTILKRVRTLSRSFFFNLIFDKKKKIGCQGGGEEVGGSPFFFFWIQIIVLIKFAEDCVSTKCCLLLLK